MLSVYSESVFIICRIYFRCFIVLLQRYPVRATELFKKLPCFISKFLGNHHNRCALPFAAFDNLWLDVLVPEAVPYANDAIRIRYGLISSLNGRSKGFVMRSLELALAWRNDKRLKTSRNF